ILDGGYLFFKQDNAKCFVVPKSMVSQVLRLHDDTGHMDWKRTPSRIKETYYWPRMRQAIRAYVTSCDTCQRFNRQTQLKSGPLVPRQIPSTPFQVVSMDHIAALPETKAGNKNIIVYVDHATPSIAADIVACSL